MDKEMSEQEHQGTVAVGPPPPQSNLSGSVRLLRIEQTVKSMEPLCGA